MGGEHNKEHLVWVRTGLGGAGWLGGVEKWSSLILLSPYRPGSDFRLPPNLGERLYNCCLIAYTRTIRATHIYTFYAHGRYNKGTLVEFPFLFFFKPFCLYLLFCPVCFGARRSCYYIRDIADERRDD